MMRFNNNNLPLVYLKSKTIRVFVVAANAQMERKNEDRIDLNHSALNPDVFLVNFDAVNVTPQVENLLSRVLVRPQLFHFCKAKGLLAIPGSAIEDRQYQVGKDHGSFILLAAFFSASSKPKLTPP